MYNRDEFLESQKIMRLATIQPDGVPHIVPVWYRFAAEKFYVGTNTKTRKARNLQGNPAVSFCIDAGVNSPIFGVMCQGTARLITDQNTVRPIAEKILLRYFDSLDDMSAAELLSETDCIIEIVPDRFNVWSY